MMNIIERTTESRFGKFIGGALSFKYFPLLTTAVLLTCYYLALDLVMIYFLIITIILMTLFLKDLTPLIPQMLFLNVIISYKNSPAPGAGYSQYYSNPAVYIQLIVLGTIAILALITRIICSRKKYRLNLTFFGLCAFGLTALFAGVGAEVYKPINLAYCVLFAFVLIGLYTLIAANVTVTKENYIKLAYGFFAFSILLVVELYMKYLVDGYQIFVDGVFRRLNFSFGWGVRNTVGMLIVISIPPVFLLATHSKVGWLYTLYATFLVISTFFSMSRQSMGGGAVAYIASAIICVIKGKKNRATNLAVLCAASIVGLIVLFTAFDKVYAIFRSMYDSMYDANGEYSGSGRVELIKEALEYFRQSPIFGQGFYLEFSADAGSSGTSIVPGMAHNTFAQLLASAGIVGLTGYLIHRVTTIISFFNKPTFNRAFMAISIATMMLMGLVDNHIFYITPTIFYATTLIFATNGDTCELNPALKKKNK